MKYPLLLKLIRFWPPFLGAGVSVKEFSKDYCSIVVQMKMRFWNKNYVGTHFGGSLYAMTDPFYVLMLLKTLGKEYVVWDKSAAIRYKKPARGKVFATFNLLPSQVAEIKAQVEREEKAEPQFCILITDSTGEVVAEVNKTLSVKRKT